MSKGKLFVGLTLMLMPVFGLALEFKSIESPKAILFDGPSAAANKQYIVGQLTPVEVIVTLADMVKVRDADGGLFWLKADDLSDTRTVVIKAQSAELHTEASAGSPVLAVVEQQVVMLLASDEAINGWLNVRSVDGTSGYIPLNAVWGY